jgi:rod shape determining protein RodA
MGGKRGFIFRNVDIWLVLIYLFLMIAGLMNIFSSTCDPYMENIKFSLSTNYGRQAIFIGVSLLIAFIILLTDGHFFEQTGYIFYAASCLLLALVVVIGTEISGAKSWIQIGNFSLQPSEFSKFATALAFSKFLSKYDYIKMTPKQKLILYGILAIPVLLIMLEPDAGSALVFLSFIIVLFREGFPLYIILLGFYLIVIVILSLIIDEVILISVIGGILILAYFYFRRHTRRKKALFLRILAIFLISGFGIIVTDYAYNNVISPHQKDRIEVLLGIKQDIKGAGYNVHQSKIAIGSGGLFGKGYLKGTQTKFDFVPEQQTDFIFCTVGEEFGFLGTFIVVCMFLALILRVIYLAEHQRTKFSRIYGYCVASIFFMHVTINVGMTIGLLPVIGIPLPFFSYGGSSLMAFTILLFIFIKLDSFKYNLL